MSCPERYPATNETAALTTLSSNLINHVIRFNQTYYETSMMLAAIGWVAVLQQWFIIKMILVIGLSFSGFLIAGPNSKHLNKLIIRLINAEEASVELNKVKRNMTLFRITEI